MCFEISAAAHQGVKELISAAADKLKNLPPVRVFEPEYVPSTVRLTSEEPEITVCDGVWIITALDGAAGRKHEYLRL
jgi:GTP-binding protein